jgi:hypothetical protein
MRKLFNALAVICMLLPLRMTAQNFAAKENNCFAQFKADATGRNDVNAYLLGYLTRLVYIQYLNKDMNLNLSLTDTSRFNDKFIERTKHFFTAPLTPIKSITPAIAQPAQLTDLKSVSITRFSKPGVIYNWVWRSDGQGKNPEAMVISTANFILVLFRGTDRVEGANPFDFDWGEWIYTDFNALDAQPPCSGCPGKVHKGFRQSLEYAGFRDELINIIKQNGGATKKVWITGHSLGGAFAQLFAYQLYKQNITAQGLYVYNSPHAGDQTFAAEMDRIFPNQRFQRFEFLDDPISCGPPKTLNWIPGMPKWGRAGTRNWFSKEAASGYNYNTAELSDAQDLNLLAAVAGALDFGGICYHHPNWIVRGLYDLLPATTQGKVPDPPARINANDEGCNTIDINHGVSGNLIDPGTDELAAGTYKIKNVNSGRYLKATQDCFLNCCDLMQESSASGNDVQWIIEKVPGAIFASYTIKSKLTSKVIDADALATKDDGCKVHLCDRLPVATGLRTNQEWRMEKLTNGNYRIKCVASDKPMRVSPGCASQDGCRFELFKPESSNTQQWVLQKVD